MTLVWKTICAVILAWIGLPALAATWYVRPDGGTRFSKNMSAGQCDGTADAPYPGRGANQHCAFKDVRYLWADGSYAAGGASFPAWGWIGKGGDTYLIRGSLKTGVSYRVGWNNNADSYDANTRTRWGLAGDPYGSGAPSPPSGTQSQHTRILGENFAACRAASAKTQLHGGYGVGAVLNLAGASYVDVACLDITDFSSCGKAGQTRRCNASVGSLDDYADTGIYFSTASTHDTLTDIHIHGMALNGMGGPTGDGMVFDYLDLLGNASSGWNADPNNGTTGTGSLQVSHYNISWNGCAEEYPLVDKLPYSDCTDDNSSGYGDGFGTATQSSNPAWNVTFDEGVVSFNTQDGLDALHIAGAGSTMTVKRTLAHSNMGQQIKVGGARGSATNNVIYTNCNAMRQVIPGTPANYNSKLSDFCRAADAGIKLTVNDGSTTIFENNTVVSASATALEVDVDSSCTTPSCTIQERNNIFIGFRNDKESGYPNGGTGNYSNPIYVDDAAVRAYKNSKSGFDHNVTFHAKSNWKCPATWLNEKQAFCGDPRLTDETWHNFGYGNTKPTQPIRFDDGLPAVPPGASTSEYWGVASSLAAPVVFAGLWQVGRFVRRKRDHRASGTNNSE